MTAALRSRGILQTCTRGYTPQANGTAEAAVKQCKRSIRRLLVHAGLGETWWGHAAMHAIGVLQTHWEGKRWKLPAFGETVVARTVASTGHHFEERGCLGRLLTYRAHGDRSSDVLVTSDGTEPEVIRCGAPVLVTDVLAALDVHVSKDTDGVATSDLRERIRERWFEAAGPDGKTVWVDLQTRKLRLTAPYVMEGTEPADETRAAPDEPVIAAQVTNRGPYVHVSAKDTTKAFHAIAAAASGGGRVQLTPLSEAW